MIDWMYKTLATYYSPYLTYGYSIARGKHRYVYCVNENLISTQWFSSVGFRVSSDCRYLCVLSVVTR